VVVGLEFQKLPEIQGVMEPFPITGTLISLQLRWVEGRKGKKGLPKRCFMPKYSLYLSTLCQGVSQFPGAKAPLLLLC
jgi:hypothetical protein